MRVGEEATGVLYNLAHVEAGASIGAVVGCVDARGEGTRETTVADPALVRALGVGEREARGARAAFDSFVDMCRGLG
jgi:hypothetical protein